MSRRFIDDLMPPNGDFARYLERRVAASAVRLNAASASSAATAASAAPTTSRNARRTPVARPAVQAPGATPRLRGMPVGALPDAWRRWGYALLGSSGSAASTARGADGLVGLDTLLDGLGDRPWFRALGAQAWVWAFLAAIFLSVVSPALSGLLVLVMIALGAAWVRRAWSQASSKAWKD